MIRMGRCNWGGLLTTEDLKGAKDWAWSLSDGWHPCRWSFTWEECRGRVAIKSPDDNFRIIAFQPGRCQ
jgi:hypothetical protein